MFDLERLQKAINIILFLSYLILVCQSNEYWVRPNTTVDCPTGVPTQRCVTLLDIAANNSRYFAANAQINFLAGIHYIQSDEGLVIGMEQSYFEQFNISLIGDQKTRTIIDCNGTQVEFMFSGIENLTLSNIDINHCGSKRYFGSDATLQLRRTEMVTISNMVIQNNIGTGLLISEISESVVITRSRFQGNHFGNGNAFISNSIERMQLTISNCIFADGLITRSSDDQDWPSFASGLTIKIPHGRIIIRNCIFYNNTGITGGHLTVYSTATTRAFGGYLKISNCKFTSANTNNAGAVNILYPNDNHNRLFTFEFKECIVQNNTGGGLKVHSHGTIHTLSTVYNNTFKHNTAKDGAGLSAIFLEYGTAFSIQSNVFLENKASKEGGAILISYSFLSSPLEITDCEFSGNVARWGSAISYKSSTPHLTRPGERETITRCTLTGHNSTQSVGSVVHLSSTVLDIKDTRITENNCRGIHLNMSTLNIKGSIWIAQNKGGGIHLNMSMLNIKGNTWISNNSAQYGGAIFLDYDPPELCKHMSQINISCDSHLYIENNSATDYGGGLMVKNGCTVTKLCFIQANECTGKVHMSGNQAGIAGTAIYGGDLDSCFFEQINATLPPKVFWSIFNITERHSGPSVVASQPYKVCICNDNFSTDHSCVFHYNVKVYPGQTFTVPVVGVGQYNYSSPAVIRAVAPQGVRLGEQQVTQETQLICKNLSFILQTNKKSATIELMIETPFSVISTREQQQHASVNVTVLDCPLGFQSNEILHVCDCLPHLSAEGITCDIFTQSLHKSPSTWIGNFSNDIVAHNNCPFDYCNPGVQDVRLTSQDDQCNWNRTGILCGACRDGYSTVFGTSRCQECSNVYLLLLLPISLAGFGLVVLLLKCNLTVSTGTLNGLIFYANIVQVNSKLFFSSYPPGPMSTLSYVLSVFIAWINLDMGIEVCFAENLNTFSQTWLQFLFPVYIWCIIGLLIIVCRYSTTVSRLTGSNTVSVLATLFLLSYAKLLRTTLNIFSPITITDPNNTAHLRWILDANYGFLHWPHLTLFLAALFTLVLHLIPFTALLLFGPTLQAHTNYRLLSWVTRIKPFLDAYQGPYKTKYRYWTGFMLLVRVLLLTVFAGNALGDPNINLLTIAVTVLTVLVVWIKIGRIYTKWPINVLEVFYLLNLGITAVATLYLRASSSSDTQQQTLSLITVGSALLVFIAVMIYHCCSALTETRRGRKLKQKILNMYQNRVTTQEEDEVIGPQVRASSPTRSEVNLRELLLEDKD